MKPIKFLVTGVVVVTLVWLTEPRMPNPLSFGGSVLVPFSFFILTLFYIGLDIILKDDEVKDKTD